MISTFDVESDFEPPSAVLGLLVATSKQGNLALDLSRRGLNELPYNFPICPKLECLYLEGNSLHSIPDNIFIMCPSLNWLDLRNNNITSLPPEISKLRNLKTLLLEGNNLTELPPELGLLQKLNGLSLSGNPLQSPPSHITNDGTIAILQYLRSQIEGKEYSSTEGESSSEDYDENYNKDRTPTRLNLLNYSIKRGSESLSSRRATLHISLDQQKRKQEHIANLLSSMEKLKKSARVKSRRKIKKPHPLIRPEIDPVERIPITDIIEREKSKQCLDEWREETKKRQEEARRTETGSAIIVPLAAPYATEESVDQLAAVSNKEDDLQSDNGSGIMTEWMKDYVRQLQQNREITTGVTSDNVSIDLLNAENKLAGALGMRKKFENDHNREYRLRAFTGDSLF